MDNRILPIRADVVSVQTAPRPTPTPVRVAFSEVLAGGAQAFMRGAQAAVNVLPGNPLAAVAVRAGGGSVTAGGGGLDLASVRSSSSSVSVGVTPEGPGGTSGPSAAVTPSGSDGGLESSMAQAQQENLYYLQIQEEVNAQNRTFTALSNVLEVEHSTAKSAIGNIH
jgi:hypothetical protein